MEWVDGFGMWEMLEMNRLEEKLDGVRLKRDKAIVKLMLKVVFEENMVSEIGKVCLTEIGCESRWWSRCRHICSKFGLLGLVNLICLREVRVNGMVNLGINFDG